MDLTKKNLEKMQSLLFYLNLIQYMGKQMHACLFESLQSNIYFDISAYYSRDKSVGMMLY